MPALDCRGKPRDIRDSCMNLLSIRTLLAIPAVLIAALMMNQVSGRVRDLALCSAGLLLGLAAIRVTQSHREHRHGRRGTVRSFSAPSGPLDLVARMPRPESQMPLEHARDTALSFSAASSQSCGVSVLDGQHRILWCSALSAMHLGIQTKTDIGEPLDSILSGSPLVAYLAAGDFSHPLRLRSAGQESRILSTWLVPYLDFRWLLLTLDVTQAVELEATRRNFVADALHEMSAPITVLAGYLDAMRGFAFGPKRLRDCLDSMEQQCHRLRRTAESLVNLSTLESAPEPPGDERIDLRVLCAEIRAEAEALSAGRHDIVLDARPEIDLFGCGSEITSAFSNLASNAVRYTPPGGEIRLTLRALPDGGVEFTVEDNGIGIALDHIPRLTERFFRVDHELSRKAAGTGIGLAIVKDVLARHQATLEIESEPGRGSRFAARFPACRVKPAAVVSATMDDCGSRVYPPIWGKAPLKVAGGRTPAPELRSAPSQVYGRVFATTERKPRRKN